MNRFSSVLVLAAVAWLLPIAAEAQQDNRYTRDANRYLALALTRQDDAQRRQMYEQAMGPLREGLQRDPDNAQLYFLLGQAEAGLGNYAEADAAYRRAVELHPPYAEEVDEQREDSWAVAAQRGIDKIGEGEYEEALRHFEGANLFSQSRPEAVYYLGNLYLHFQRWDESHQAYIRTVEIIDAAPADTPEELLESWDELRSTARQHLGLVITQRGATAFEAEDYTTALAAFRESVELSPHSRDNWLNVTVAAYNQLLTLRDRIDEVPEAGQQEHARQINEMAQAVEDAATQLARFDPLNVDLEAFLALAHQTRAEVSADEAEENSWRQRMLAVLEQREAREFTVQDINVLRHEDGSAEMTGVIVNYRGTAGAPAQLRLTITDREANTLASTETTVTLGAEDEPVPFRATFAIDDAIQFLNWKYEVIR